MEGQETRGCSSWRLVSGIRLYCGNDVPNIATSSYRTIYKEDKETNSGPFCHSCAARATPVPTPVVATITPATTTVLKLTDLYLDDIPQHDTSRFQLLEETPHSVKSGNLGTRVIRRKRVSFREFKDPIPSLADWNHGTQTSKTMEA